MKTSTIRKLASVYGTTDFKPHPTVPVCCKLLDPLPTKESSDSCTEKRRHQKRRFLRMYGGPSNYFSSTKDFKPATDKSSTYSNEISIRNFNIMSIRFNHRIAYWQLYLSLKEQVVNTYRILSFENPEDKALFSQYKKVERSFIDSLKDFIVFYENYKYLKNYTPLNPIPFGFKTSDNSCKLIEKKSREFYKKKRKQHIKQFRKRKEFEKDFWLSQWENFDETDETDETIVDYIEEQYTTDDLLFKEITEAQADLIDAYFALDAKCVEDAAWAIHDGTEEQFTDSILEANKLLTNYQQALERFELLESYT